MILYKDIFTGQDVFTDCYKMELVDDLYYRVHGKFIIEDLSISDDLIGGNKSAEVEGDDDEDNKRLIPDIVSSNKLEQTPSIVSKNDYKVAIKDYIGKLVNKVTETDPERAQFLKDNVKDKFVMPMMKKFKELRIYACSGDEFDLEGGLIHFEQEAKDGSEEDGTKCCIIVLKDGLEEEKC